MEPIADLLGHALRERYLGKSKVSAITLTVEGLWEEQMPLDPFFRGEMELSDLDAYALDLCRGSVLDIGAGIGSISLILQSRGFEVLALEKSPAMMEVMKRRGIRNRWEGEILDFSTGRYDTILLLMNGLGLAGRQAKLPSFLDHLGSLLAPGGHLLVDSSSLRYLYPKPAGQGFWEVEFQYSYGDRTGVPFHWLYMDFQALLSEASKLGWEAQNIFEDSDGQYLARLWISQT